MSALQPGGFPTSLPLVWVAGRFAELHTGAPVVGRHLQAVPSGRWYVDRAAPAPRPILAPKPVSAVTDATGFVAVALEAITDDPGIVPAGSTWQLTDPLRRTYPLAVRSDQPVWHMPTPPPGVTPDPRLVALDGHQVIWLDDALPDAAPDAGTVQLIELEGPRGIQGPQGEQGIQGIEGPPGPSPAAGFVWTQQQPLKIVQIFHGLSYDPAGITCVDFDGVPWDTPQVTYPAPGWLELQFAVPFNGVIRGS